MRPSIAFTLTLLLSASVSVPPVVAAESQEKTHPLVSAIHQKKGVNEEIIIKAPPAVVWQSMQVQRHKDPDSTSVKVVKKTTNGKEVEQCFSFPSPFGSAECALSLFEKSEMRIDYNLKDSEDLKAMEGSWILTATDDGRSTKLSLSSYVEPNIYVPRLIVNAIIKMHVQRNLHMVKNIAETSDLATLAQNGNLQ